MTPLRFVAPLALSAALLAGCGSDDDTPSSDSSSSSPSSDESSDDTSAEAPDVEPATGDELTTDDFTFNAPDGWTQNDEAAPTALIFAADMDDKDGFADNVNVIGDPTLSQVDDIDTIEQGIERSLSAANAEDVTIGDPIDLDGTEAATVSSVFSLNGQKYAVYQYAVSHEGSGYVITFSYSLDRPAQEQKEIAESVAATWKWAS